MPEGPGSEAMDMDVKAELARRAALVEAFLAGCLTEDGLPEDLAEAMRYSLLAGGKRLRPVLCLTWAAMLGLPEEAAMPFAVGFELIHTYSLIHDDLPAMDDDDLRRGKPSNHKAYGEALAILAGDGLLTRAFGLMASVDCVPAENVLRAVRVAAWGAGPAGMVGGQVLDMAHTGLAADMATMQRMHAMKTGALITAACLCGAVLAGADEADRQRAHEYGAKVGLAFQIVDDVLDVVGDTAVLGKPAGSDQGSDKATYPKLVGLDESRRLAGAAADAAVAAIAPHAGPEADFLAALARYIVVRAH